MKVNSVTLLALGISISLHLSLLFLNNTKPSQTEALNHQSPNTSPLLVISLAEKAEKLDIQKANQLNGVAKDTTSGKHSGRTGVNADSGLAAPLQETYFKLDELEEHPRILEDIEQNPAELKPYAHGGRVVLQLWIDEHGSVVNQKLVETFLPAVFVDNAMKSFSQAKFIAGVKDGRPVKSTVKVVINYDPVTS